MKQDLINKADAFAQMEAEGHITGKKIAYDFAFRCFLAGEKSRNEEIEKLKEGKCALRRSLHKRISALVKEIDGLEDELNKIRNPWHSADELPEENPNMKGYSVPVIADFAHLYYERAYVSLEECIWFQGGVVTDKPVRWMYIPKGGEK